MYLRQHADNPVNWFPWGSEAFELAARADKPVLLSVGYSACHWCHVMAHESFEDPATAELMNRLFVCIKVDREERPDVDAVYMQAIQAMTGHGGWPLTAFLTPAGDPFYGGTYYPPTPRQGMPAFRQVLVAVADAWRDRRGAVVDQAGVVMDAVQRALNAGSDRAAEVDSHWVAARASALAGAFDPDRGGLRGAPKFPNAPTLMFLMGQAVRGDTRSGHAVLATLRAMAAGGIHDQLGNGFHRYSVDADWTVPHFEKMLYDNAQLALVYTGAWQCTGLLRLRQAAESALDFLVDDMQAPHGGIGTAVDADSDGREGAYYVWTPAEFQAALGGELSALARDWYGVTDQGNFEGGASVLTARRDPVALAGKYGLSPVELAAQLREARTRLLAVRASRPAPAVDPKVVAAWNGMAIEALASGGAAFGRSDFVRAAERAAQFVRAHMTTGTGLVRTWDGAPGPARAFAEDYAALASGAVSLYEATFDHGWLVWAEELVERLERDHAGAGGGFQRQSRHHDGPNVAEVELGDGAEPGGNAAAARAMWRLGALTGRTRHLEAAWEAARLVGPLAEAAPAAAGTGLQVLADLGAGIREVVLAGSETGPAAAAVRGAYLPGTVVALSPAGDGPVAPVAADRHPPDGAVWAAYICRGGVCDLPITDLAELVRELGGRFETASEMWRDVAS